ncbi:efflux RND transporter periplasmic adaptor subunit [Neiella marina]|uniref:Efflux RND transporter periplasmic adaptor subunit n=1 Tax=Neiella holothuriorum TaxID=2870530 RepID=A0ABS7EHQ3_9GAMM|nr:efflux RND transporter periplasmic adaptor subunit [Neiella holothuriorum]MBW8191866.1 efflux RND transporter periplasmic adaptor subunit [Neiella holothuriorum]
MKKYLWLSAAAAAVIIGYVSFSGSGSEGAVGKSAGSYRTEAISRGDIRNTVSATGTLAAVDDVVVGAQLSGQITEVHVDFNDSVAAGQLLALIDPRTFAAQVAQAQALLDKTSADIELQKIAIKQAQVNYEQAVRNLRRVEGLVAANHISEDELDSYQTAVEVQQLAWQQAKAQLNILHATEASNAASLEQATIELERTEIRSPIDGFVIDRTIEAGQTVASSYNTPELFTLARDLSEMEIEAYIDESDIGRVMLEQRVAFNVDAFPDREFRGEVSQIQKAPQSDSGVVSYTVVINAKNRNGMLLPGMTANLEIAIDSLPNVQRVPNAALRAAQRFGDANDSEKRRGPMSMLEQLNLSNEQREILRERLPKPGSGFGRGVAQQQRQRMEQVLDEVLTPQQQELRAKLRNGQLRVGHLLVVRGGGVEKIEVKLGISDDSHTAVLEPDLTGEQVVTQIRATKS